MPSEAPALPTQTEKPQHYMYLKEFRTQQCPLFLQHKCTQHRPYTCFHWHFMNQRRRRPIRKRDGTFNYSPDVYCTKYDETTGICPEGDECPFLHRTAGDTERRYHLRYYKTCTCVHETDAKGHCVKNGPHCAFAHGAHDLRPPVYDIRELQALNGGEKGGLVEAPSAATQLERDRIINEDPRWNDTNYVLANYKTEQCKRPPRLCRQGYACPQYHNNRDRRRSPKKFKYRSTPCPNVKHGDEWGDSAQCDSGDNCPYCHTRTEQQFHPEIYKSSKCNDMVQTGYCPRGPFCAFAHVEQEMTTQRDLPLNDNSLAAFVTNILPVTSGDGDSMYNQRDVLDIKVDKIEENNRPQTSPRTNGSSGLTNSNRKLSNSSPGIPEPIGKGRSLSTSAFSDGGCWKAPGSERDDPQAKLRIHLQAIDNDPTLDCTEKSKRKQNLLLLHNLSISNALSSSLTTALGSTPTTPSSTVSSTMSPHAPSFYPPGDTVESVIGNALEEDLDLGELSLSSIDKDLAKDNDDTNSVSSSISAGLTYNAGYLGTSSVPVTIPSSGIQRGSIGSLSPTSSSPMATFTSPFFSQVLNSHRQEHPVEQAAAAAFMCQPNTSKQQVPPIGDYNSMSPRNGLPQSPLMSSSFTGNAINGNSEVQRLREELATNKIKLAQWEDRIAQARSACDAWKKEAEESMRKAKQAEEERLMVIKQRDEAIQQVAQLKQELDRLPSSPYLHCLQRISELETLPAQQIKHIQSQLRQDLETVEKVIFQYTAYKCMVCQEKNRNIIVLPCNHFVLCDGCASKRNDCSFCHTPIAQRTPMVLPM